MKSKVKAIILILLLPLLYWGVTTFESRSLYHPDTVEYADPMVALQEMAIKNQIQEVYFKTNDGVKLNAW